MISEIQSLSTPSTATRTNKASLSSNSSQAEDVATVTLSPRALELMNSRKVSEQDRETFKEILSRAKAAEAYSNPKEFLQGLSSSDMEVLRKTHTLAEKIQISPLDFEGAFNLLMAPGDAKDLNNDGALGVGMGKGWVFPPPNAPDNVKAAWDEATSGMTFRQKALMMGSFLFQSRYNYNMKPGPEIGFYEPGDPEFRNIFTESGFSYKDYVQDRLKSVKRVDPTNVEIIEFLTKFGDALDKNNAT